MTTLGLEAKTERRKRLVLLPEVRAEGVRLRLRAGIVVEFEEVDWQPKVSSRTGGY